MTDPEIIYIPDMARLLNTTEAAVRGKIQRDSASLPPSFRIGRRVAWRLSSVKQWLDKKDARAARALSVSISN